MPGNPAPDICRVLSRRDLLRTSLVAGGAALLAACQAPSGAAPPVATSAPSGNPDWDRVLAAARQEGTVSLYGGRDNQFLVDGFQSAYPGIRVNGIFDNGPDLVTRIQAERTAGKYLADLLIGTGASAIFPLKPVGALAPISPTLMLPEVTDTSNWLNNQLWYIDAEQPLTTLAFEGDVNPTLTVNSDMVDPKQFHSYTDLLDPQWKGKLCMTDVRHPGAGAVPMRFFYTQPDLGPDFIRRLFTETDATLSTDARQLTDWVGQGRFPVGVMLNFTDITAGMQDGLPLAWVSGNQFKEGAPFGPGGGTVTLIDSGPNPNAAAVFINWLLGRDGQTRWQNHSQGNSLRIDIPKDNVLPVYIPTPGVEYPNMGVEKYAVLSTSTITPMLNQLLGSS